MKSANDNIDNWVRRVVIQSRMRISFRPGKTAPTCSEVSSFLFAAKKLSQAISHCRKTTGEISPAVRIGIRFGSVCKHSAEVLADIVQCDDGGRYDVSEFDEPSESEPSSVGIAFGRVSICASLLAAFGTVGICASLLAETPSADTWTSPECRSGELSVLGVSDGSDGRDSDVGNGGSGSSPAA